MRLVRLWVVAIALATSMLACRIPGQSIESNYNNVDQFNFDVAMGPKNYHIEGYLTRSAEQGRRPGRRVLNGGEGNVDRCVKMSQGIAAMGIQVACVNIPGYGGSTGPSRFVGQPSVVASLRALDQLAGRADAVDGLRLAPARADPGIGMLRPDHAMAGSAAAHQAVDPARSMAEQANTEGAQRDREFAAEARMQCADHAWRAG